MRKLDVCINEESMKRLKRGNEGINKAVLAKQDGLHNNSTKLPDIQSITFILIGTQDSIILFYFYHVRNNLIVL